MHTEQCNDGSSKFDGKGIEFNFTYIYVPYIFHCEQKISVTYASDKAERANVLNIAEWMMNDNKTHAVRTPYHYELSLFDI